MKIGRRFEPADIEGATRLERGIDPMRNNGGADGARTRDLRRDRPAL
jgi:hypothetical protein